MTAVSVLVVADFKRPVNGVGVFEGQLERRFGAGGDLPLNADQHDMGAARFERGFSARGQGDAVDLFHGHDAVRHFRQMDFNGRCGGIADACNANQRVGAIAAIAEGHIGGAHRLAGAGRLRPRVEDGNAGRACFGAGVGIRLLAPLAAGRRGQQRRADDDSHEIAPTCRQLGAGAGYR